MTSAEGGMVRGASPTYARGDGRTLAIVPSPPSLPDAPSSLCLRAHRSSQPVGSSLAHRRVGRSAAHLAIPCFPQVDHCRSRKPRLFRRVPHHMARSGALHDTSGIPRFAPQHPHMPGASLRASSGTLGAPDPSCAACIGLTAHDRPALIHRGPRSVEGHGGVSRACVIPGAERPGAALTGSGDHWPH